MSLAPSVKIVLAATTVVGIASVTGAVMAWRDPPLGAPAWLAAGVVLVAGGLLGVAMWRGYAAFAALLVRAELARAGRRFRMLRETHGEGAALAALDEDLGTLFNDLGPEAIAAARDEIAQGLAAKPRRRRRKRA